MNRVTLALVAFWQAITDRNRADRIREALGPPSLVGPDFRVLALLQRDGRLIDFLQEEIASYSDEQIGAAARDIHRGCRKAMAEYLKIDPVLQGQEGEAVVTEADFDPAAIRLLGNVSGAGPYRGTLKHHGWRISSTTLPAIPPTRDGMTVLAPAEIDVD